MLEREMFSEAEAARLLRVAQSTLHYWLEGGQRRGRTYQPVIRVEPRGTRSVTWAEFIEAGLLRQYRREQACPWPSSRLHRPAARGHGHPLSAGRPPAVHS